MKLYSVKYTFLITALLFSLACLINACTKKDFPHAPFVSTKNDSLAKIDSLPSFSSPAGLVLDAAGNIYVADYGNSLIRKITPAGVVSTFAGSGTQGSFNGTGLLATFNQPSGIAIDASGNLYVADSGNDLIRMITPAGVVSTLAGGDTTANTRGDTSNNFFDPTGIAIGANGIIYVADAGDNQIRQIIVGADTAISALAGNDSLTTTFNNPTGVALDTKGNIFAANYLDNNILEINPLGLVSTFAGTGQIGAANGAANAATFYLPNSVAVDKAGNVYVSDGVNNLIRKITAAGVVTTLAGSGAIGAVDSTGTAASFNGPAGLAVDALGNLYVADANNNLIRKITPAGVVTTIAGNGQPDSKNGVAIAHRNTKPIHSLKHSLDIFRKRRRN